MCIRDSNVLDTGAPFYEVYECADGRHLAIGALEPAFYAELVARLGDELRDVPGSGFPLSGDDPRQTDHRLDQTRWPEAKALWAVSYTHLDVYKRQGDGCPDGAGAGGDLQLSLIHI